MVNGCFYKLWYDGRCKRPFFESSLKTRTSEGLYLLKLTDNSGKLFTIKFIVQ